MGCIRFGALLSVLIVTVCAQVKNNNEYCVLRSGYNGMCVRYFNCHPKSTFMVLRTDSGWKCSSYLDVCCPENDILEFCQSWLRETNVRRKGPTANTYDKLVLHYIIVISAVSYCATEDNYEDILIFASSDNCEINSSENNGEGVCVKENQCRIPLMMPDPEISTSKCKCCCPVHEVIITHKPKTPIQLGCGYSNPGGLSFRFSNKATNAEYADFPWMVALMIKKDIPNKTFADEYIGGGTIIHPSVVMTVAHKVHKSQPEQLKCRAGEWTWLYESEKDKYQERDVANIIINEIYNNVYIHYDVALLVLSSPFHLVNTPHIGVGCLEPNLPSAGTICYSMGWGIDILAKNDSAKILKKLGLPLVGHNECERLLKNTILGDGYRLHKSLTCAGGEVGVDTCEGDGGSPLVCRIPDRDGLRYSVVGMVAYGVECWNQNVPGVYAKVPELYDWIINKMTTLNFNISSFKY